MSDSDYLPSSKNASVSDNGKSGDSSPPSQESSSLPPLESSPPPPFQESSPSPPFQESSPSPPSQESISSPPSQESKSSPPSPESNSSPPSSNSSSLNSSSPSTPGTSNSSSSLPPPPPLISPPPPPLISQPPPPSSSQSDSPSQNKSSDDVLVPPSKSESIPSTPNYVPSDESPPSSSSSPSPSSGSNHNTHEFVPTGDAKSPPKPSQSHSSHRPTDDTPVGSSDSSYSDERQARSTPPSSPLSLGSLKAAFNGGDISTGAVVILVLVVVVITVIMIFFINARRKKKRKNALVDPYRQPPSFSVKPANYYNRNGSTMGRPNLFDPQNGAPPRLSNASTSTYGSQRGQVYYSGPDPSCSKSWFSYEEMVSITNGFSGENLIGEGGFGCVYKGILPDGKQVAVKQLKSGSGQGEREFRAEVEIISRVHHRYLVSLVGYSIFETQRLLVYEFVPNNTLEHHLHGKGLHGMDWPKRLKIAIGSAKGLAYLHEDCHPRIIHRDIKSANILIDNDWEAQVADFGLAKLSNDTHTHVSTRVMGTFGYLAPEYASSGKLTDRSDVFSFGVVLLEIITGRKPVDASQPLGDESLVEWARPLLVDALETGDCNQLVDPRLENIYVKDEMLRMIKVAAACVRHSAPKRPRMVQVVRALDCEGDMADLSNGMKFGQSQVYDSGQQSANIHRFRLMALGTEDFSSEHGYSGEFDRRSSSHSGEYHSRDFYRPRSHEYRSQSREYNGHVPQNRNFSKLWRSEEISGDDSGEAESRAMYRSSCERSDVGNHGYGSKVGLP